MNTLPTFVISLLLLLITTFAVAASPRESRRSEAWNIPHSAYGQIRLVPFVKIPRFAEEQDWDGPWTVFESFEIVVTCGEGEQVTPEQYKFVTPTVSIEGYRDGTTESSSRAAPMFRTESTDNDINITFEAPPKSVAIDQEYLAATLSGKKAETEWKVFVRFKKEKPGYIKVPSE